MRLIFCLYGVFVCLCACVFFFLEGTGAGEERWLWDVLELGGGILELWRWKEAEREESFHDGFIF